MIEGDAHRYQVFICCAGLLLLSGLVSVYILGEGRTAGPSREVAEML
jgi:hypothetical protein